MDAWNKMKEADMHTVPIPHFSGASIGRLWVGTLSIRVVVASLFGPVRFAHPCQLALGVLLPCLLAPGMAIGRFGYSFSVPPS